MKNILLIISVAIFIFSCSETGDGVELRIKNNTTSSTASWFMNLDSDTATTVKVTVDGTEFDISSLASDESTDYQTVDEGSSHTVTTAVTYSDGGTGSAGGFTELASANLEAGNKYTYGYKTNADGKQIATD